MPFVFSHVEYCDMHFVYGFCDGNARAAVEEYQRRFPDRMIPSMILVQHLTNFFPVCTTNYYNILNVS